MTPVAISANAIPSGGCVRLVLVGERLDQRVVILDAAADLVPRAAHGLADAAACGVCHGADLVALAAEHLPQVVALRGRRGERERGVERRCRDGALCTHDGFGDVGCPTTTALGKVAWLPTYSPTALRTLPPAPVTTSRTEVPVRAKAVGSVAPPRISSTTPAGA